MQYAWVVILIKTKMEIESVTNKMYKKKKILLKMELRSFNVKSNSVLNMIE